MNDASDERFVSPLIPIDWTGWKEIQVTNPERWTHYLSNNDGAPAEGAIYADDIDLRRARPRYRIRRAPARRPPLDARRRRHNSRNRRGPRRRPHPPRAIRHGPPPRRQDPAILRFERQSDGAYRITGPGWQDTIRLTAEGVDYRLE